MGGNKIVKDKRGMADLEEKTDGRKVTRRGFLAGAMAVAIGLGSVLGLPGCKSTKQIKGSGIEKVEEPYRICNENGKEYFEGEAYYPRKVRDDYYLSDKTKFFKKEIIDKGEVVGEKKSRCGGGYMHHGTIIKFKDGQHYLLHPTDKFIGQTSDGSIIIQDENENVPHLIPKNKGNEEDKKIAKKQPGIFWKTEEEKAKEDTYYNPFDPRIFLAK